MTVPFLDVGAAYRELRPDIDTAVARVMTSGWYILGEELEAFEAEYAAYVGARHCVGVANGLDALHLGLRAMGIGPGDEVIVPANTYIATWLAVSQTGAIPVPVEPDARTYNMDPDRITDAITPRTRALLPVHLYGQPADLEPMLRIAADHGIRVLADAAQAHGASRGGRRVGSDGDATAWSFYPGKNLGAMGDGGAITTSDASLAERLRLLRNYGSRVKYANEIQGYNSRLDELQAAILRAKLPHLDRWNARRAELAGRYHEALASTGLVLPFVPDACRPAWHVYVVRTPKRDHLREQLATREIQTLIHYPVPPYKQPAYRETGFDAQAFPITNAIHAEVLSLPMGPHLSNEQQESVIAALIAFGGER